MLSSRPIALTAGASAARARGVAPALPLQRPLQLLRRNQACWSAVKEDGATASPAPERSASPSPESSSPEPASPEVERSRSVSAHAIEVTEQDTAEDYFASKELVEELQQGFGSKGEVWFFAQMAVFALLVVCPFKLQGIIDLVGTLALTTGIVFICYSLLSLGRNLSPMPQPRRKHELVTTGAYAYVRHPMYAGLLLAALGLAALSRSETRMALTVLLFWILEQKVAVEEKYLHERYGAVWEQYSSKVKKYVPWLL